MTTSSSTPPSMSGAPTAARRPAPGRRCVRHDTREAVGRCTACEGGFCRECITEHEGKLYCAPCFARRVESAKKVAKPRDWKRLRAAALTAGSVLCLVVGFYLLGRLLAAVPPEFHDGTIWREELAK